jgi:hypothetical protein
MIYSFPSTSRDVYAQPNANTLTFDLAKNPIQNVQTLHMGQVIMPKSQLNLTRSRSITFQVSGNNTVQSVSLDPDFITTSGILSALSSLITAEVGGGETVTFGTNTQGWVQATSSVALTLFPDMPVPNTTNDTSVWEYADMSYVHVLGFSMHAPTVIPAGNTVSAIHLPGLYGHKHVLVRLRVNGVQVGNVFERCSGELTTGPFFSKIALDREPGDVKIVKNVVGYHAFTSDPKKITKLQIEIFEPIVGDASVLKRYDLNLREWSMNLIVNQKPPPNYTDAPPGLRLSISSKSRDVFSRIPIHNPIPISEIPTPSPEAIKSFTTELSTPSFVMMNVDKPLEGMRNVQRISIGETFFWHTFPLTSITWRWWTDIPSMFKVENVESWFFVSSADLIAGLNAAMSQDGETVQWSLVDGRMHILSSVKTVLFPDAPVPTGGLSVSYFENL